MNYNNTFQVPKDGIAGLKQNWKRDIFAAWMVFILTFPFYLSIAFAAQLPALSGIISAIVGALAITFLSGSHLTIKSPSLAMTPVMLIAVQTLGSGYLSTTYKYVFALVVIAGLLQILFGILKIGDWLGAIPESVTHGILAMIAITIFSRQIYYLVGLEPQAKETLWLLIEFPQKLFSLREKTAFIGLLSLFILFLSTRLRFQSTSFLPASLFVILMGIALGFYFELHRNTFLFIQIPTNYSGYFIFPDFSRIFTRESIELILMIALVNTLETLVNINSIDSLDFYRRKSRPNRELFALGVGNTLNGLLGGMPVISSMIFSATNVNNAAKTRWANFFHGLFLLVFLLLAGHLIAYIPIASLSAILIYTCYKLCSRRLFSDILQIGREQFLIFSVAMLTALFWGILWGILAGFLSSLLIFLVFGTSPKSLFRLSTKTVNYGNNHTKIMIRSEALATNYMSLKKIIKKIPKGNHIYLDFSRSGVVDHSFLELVYHHPYNYSLSDESIELQGLEEHYPLSAHPLATRRLIKKKKKQNTDTARLYNERQLEVLAVASINNAKIRCNLTYDGNKLQGFSFALGYDIKYRENKFTKNYHSAKIEFSDIFLSKGIRLSEQSHHMSVLLIFNIQKYIPAFTLRREGILAKVLQSAGYEDIDFKEHPSFSEHYLLIGMNESEIRKFFNDQLLSFLERNQDYEMESCDNRILIYYHRKLMNRVELEDAMYFAEELLDTIYESDINESLPNHSTG